LDARDNTPLDGTVTLVGRAAPNTIPTDPDVGDYHRVIGEGDYTLNASAACYQSQSANVSVISGTVTTQDFYLEPIIDLSPSIKTVSTSQAYPGDIVDYQLILASTCLTATTSITDTLPPQVTWTGYLTATQGIPSFEGGNILWQGEVAQSQPVTITYAVSLNQCLAAGTDILNIAQLDDGLTSIITRTAQVTVTNAAPSEPSSPSPADGAVSQPLTTTLAWVASADLNCDAITYDIAFGTSPNPPIVVTDTMNTSYEPGVLLPNTTYYWYVIAKDGLTQTPGPTWSFTTHVVTILQKIFLPLTIK